MDATGSRRPLLPHSAPEEAAARLRHALADPFHSFFTEAGRLGAFSARALLATRGVFRYTSEILRQTGMLILGSALVLFALQFIIGLTCGTEMIYILRSFGAEQYAGAGASLCSLREAGMYVFGFAIAAKIGTGLAAELGTMRINEEIDALESAGLDPMQYLVATRMLAWWLAAPLFFFGGMSLNFLGEYLVVVTQLDAVSRGGFEQVLFSWITPFDVFVGLTKVWAMGTIIVLVGMYFGYRASGGPTGVGAATARSMIVNMPALLILNALATMAAWGYDPGFPIGGG